MVTVTPSRRSSGATCGTRGASGNGRLEYFVSRIVTFPWVRDFPKLTSAAAIDRLATNRISNRFIVYTPGNETRTRYYNPGYKRHVKSQRSKVKSQKCFESRSVLCPDCRGRQIGVVAHSICSRRTFDF